MRTSSVVLTSIALALAACSTASVPDTLGSDPPDASAPASDSGATPASASDASAVGTGDSGSSLGSCAPPALLDCSAAANQSDPRCLPRPSQEMAGALGSGFAPAQLDSTTGIGSGFVDTASCRLVSVLRNFQVAEHGLVFATNLTTGARSVVSGSYDDPASGPVTVGAASAVDGGPGPDLDGIEDVQPEPSGKWLAYIQKPMTDELMRLQLVEIDPANGNRSLVWEAQEATTPNNELPCLNGSTSVILQPNATSLAVGSDGAAYLPVNDPTGAGRGLIRIKDGQCSVVSMTDGNVTAGSGIANPQGDLVSARYAGGKVYVLNDLDVSLLSIDVTTGARVRISSSDAQNELPASQTTLVPLGTSSLALSGSAILTAGDPSSYFNIASVDPTTGLRTGYQVTATASNGNVGPVSLAQESSPFVYPYPGSSLFVITLETGVVLYDPTTNDSNLLSR